MLIAAAVFVAACGDDAEELPENPDIRGSITTLTPGSGDVIASLLIEGDIEPDTSYDKASVRIDDDTRIYRSEAGQLAEVTAGDLAEGQEVEAWFVGPVAESYPVQARAGKIVIIG